MSVGGKISGWHKGRMPYICNGQFAEQKGPQKLYAKTSKNVPVQSLRVVCVRTADVDLMFDAVAMC